MTPVVIPSTGGDCFAMYAPGPGTAILMCPPFGDEAIHTARVWRDLAVRLGEQGLASLRFDLPGTGNSSGEPTDADQVENWQAALRACVAWLAERHDGQVALFGYRFGALLALDLVGSGVAVKCLVLLDPPASGSAQVRLLKARARLQAAGPPPEGDDYIQVGGVPVSEATLHAIAALPNTLDGLTWPPSLLVLPGSSPWPDRLRTQGSAVETMTFEGHSDFVLHDAFRAKTPLGMLDEVTVYLARNALPIASPSVITMPPASKLACQGFTESAIQFGPDQQIFGILCRPGSPGSGPALLLPTTGADPCSGISRMWTELARKLAHKGVTSVRFDMRGIGESGGASSANLLTTVYAPERVGDLRAAIDRLSDMGFESVCVVGYCAGAYAAWHGALRDARIIGVLAGNLLHLNAMAITEETLKLRPGHSQIGHGRAARAATGSSILIPLLRRLDDGARSFVPRSARLWLRRWTCGSRATRRHLTALVSRGCSVSFVMSHDDHGHVRLRQAYGEQPVLPCGVELTVIENADHQFSNRHHRARFLELAAAFVLRQRLQRVETAVPSRPVKVLETV